MSAYNLDEEQLDEFKEAYSLHQDKEGRLKPVDLAILMRFLGQNCSDGEIMDMMTENGSGGFMNQDSFLKMMGKKYQQDDGEEELIKSFQVFDKDGKGSITSVELRFILTGLGDRISDEEAENIISQADPSGGGTINYTSFVRQMLQYMK